MEIQLGFFGAVGALCRDVVEDGALQLPSLKDKKLYLGIIGSMFLGIVVGYFVDTSPLTAFFSGYAGYSAFDSILSKVAQGASVPVKGVEQVIRSVAALEQVDGDLAVRVAQCESGLNPNAVNVNADGSIDRGLFQINNRYHPDTTEIQAFDPEYSTHFFCQAFKNGHLDWWNATKQCWNK